MRYSLSIITFIVLAAAVLNAHAEPPSLQDLLPALSSEDTQTLLGDGKLLRFHPDGMSPGLLPNTALTAAAARQLIAGDLNLGIEGLFFTPIEELPEGYASASDKERTLKLYNILRSVSTLTGLEYYSASRGRMRLLFEESWAISDLKTFREPLPDPLVSIIPAADSLYIHQKDKSFATHQSKMTFTARPGAFSAAIVNITPLRYKGLIRVVNPGNMQTHLIVVPGREGLLIYGAMSARTRNVKLFLDRAQASFTNRIAALADWYTARLAKEFSSL